MSSRLRSKGGCKVRAFKGDAMTLLCFDLDKSKTADCAGFSIRIKTPGQKSFYLYNRLSFEKPLTPGASAADQEEAITPSDKSPFQKFSWLHVPTSSYDAKEEFGTYQYEVTPRYFRNGKLEKLDPMLTVGIDMEVEPFRKGKFRLGFTRGFMLSQAYARRFGNDTSIRPAGNSLLFDTSAASGKYPAMLKNVGGHEYSYHDQYEWMGWQAHDLIFATIDEVLGDSSLSMDVFAYDLDEPDIAAKFLQLASLGRIRMILDNSSSHVTEDNKPSAEDLFEQAFRDAATGAASITRGRFSRQAHQKTFVILKNGKPIKVLTGSTNFAINGLYINANHVMLIDNKKIAETYASVFEASFIYLGSSPKPPLASLTAMELFSNTFRFNDTTVPSVSISFAPHSEANAKVIMNELNDTILHAHQSVLFAVMSLASNTSGPVVATLRNLHENESVFSYGITDSYDGVVVYRPASKRGILVDTASLAKNLPRPFKKETGTSAHKVHHKFVIVDFKSQDAVVYCGSSNLALLGEQENGDNLLAIHDRDVATAFAVEAFRLIDHYHFRASLGKSSTSEPMVLVKDNSWLMEYYQDGHMKKLSREYLIK